MRFIKHIYNRLSENYFCIIQSVQIGILMGLGDFVAQILIEEKLLAEVHMLRTIQYFSVGVWLLGPLLVAWYKLLSVAFGEEGKSTALKKVLADQLIFAPASLAFFMIVINTLQHKGWSYIKEQLHTKYLDILLTNYMIWPLVQTVNFHYVHVNHQVLLSQTVAFFWNIYLSWKTQHVIEK